jgi:DNA-binding MurR/RpiR family transcriptional regulator
MNPAKRAVAQQMFDARTDTVAAIAAELGVSRTTVYRNIDTRPPAQRSADGAIAATT